jgi:hypothetical protein
VHLKEILREAQMMVDEALAGAGAARGPRWSTRTLSRGHQQPRFVADTKPHHPIAKNRLLIPHARQLIDDDKLALRPA